MCLTGDSQEDDQRPAVSPGGVAAGRSAGLSVSLIVGRLRRAQRADEAEGHRSVRQGQSVASHSGLLRTQELKTVLVGAQGYQRFHLLVPTVVIVFVHCFFNNFFNMVFKRQTETVNGTSIS